MVADGTPCLGPVTQAGCGAICPAYGRGCYGCFGPRENANAIGLTNALVEGAPGDPARDPIDVGRLFAGFTGASAPFRAATALAPQPPRSLRPSLARPPELVEPGPARWGSEDDDARD